MPSAFVSELSPAPPAQKTWQAGTLTYTAAGLGFLFLWLLWGDFAWSMRDRAVPPVMQIVFKKYQVSDTVIALLFSSIPIAIGFFYGPFISYVSDNYRSRRGRRLPFLTWTIPFIVLAIAGMAFSPWGGRVLHDALGSHAPGLRTLVLTCLIAFWMIFEAACGIANMVFGGLVNDVVPREMLGRFYGFFRIVSLLAGIAFNYWIFGHAEDHLALVFLGIGALYGAGLGAMCLKVREGEYPAPEPRSPNGGPLRLFWTATTHSFRNGFRHPYYLWVFAAATLSGLAFVPFNMYSVLYAKSLGMSMADYGKCVSLTYVVSIALAYPLGWLCDRFHPLRMTILVVALYGASMAYFGATVHGIPAFSAALVVQTILSGVFFTVSASLPMRLFPPAQFIQISSAGGIVNSVVWIGYAPLVGMLLDHTHHAYRLTFWIAAALAAVAVVSNLLLYRQFHARGGTRNYVPPE